LSLPSLHLLQSPSQMKVRLWHNNSTRRVQKKGLIVARLLFENNIKAGFVLLIRVLRLLLIFDVKVPENKR
jgi:hypothetical protein